jgi:histidinol-phosphate aminotransferase
MLEHVDAMHFYPDGGAFYLRRRLADMHNVSMDQVVVGNGSNELIEFLGHVFLGPGTSLVMSDHAFIVYKLIGATFQAETISVPMQQFTHDLDAMMSAIRDDTRLVFVANPNNPTGTQVDSEHLYDMIKRLPDHVLLVLDEAYVELLPSAEQPEIMTLIKEGYPVCVLRTFSKAYGLAGLRIGYAIGQPEHMQLLQRVRQPFNVSAMAQAAALAALDDEEHLGNTRTMIQEGALQLCKACEQMGLEYVPSVTNFMLIKTGAGRDTFRRLQREGVIVRPMDVYQLPDYIRVTIGTTQQNQQFISALGRVCAL